MKRYIAFALLSAFVGIAGSASATIYRWTWDETPLGYNNAAGNLSNFNVEYNPVADKFGAKFTIAENSAHKKADKFYMVVSNGPNPKGTPGQLAIFYVDGSGSAPVLTAYGYNGKQDGIGSWQDGSSASGTQSPDKIGSSLNGFGNFVSKVNNANGSSTYHFEVPGSVMNSYTPINSTPDPWEGVAFGPKFGLWFGTIAGGNIQYGGDNFISNFSLNGATRGWLDLDNRHAEVVPEPMTMTALAVGLAALARRRKKA